MAGNGAFADAVERAKQIVSKFSSSDEGSATNGSLAGMKRPAQDDNSFPVTEKRPLVMDKVAAAAEAAARLNQKLGGSQPPNPPMNPSAPPKIPYQQPPVQLVSRESSIPDRYVGLPGTPERTVTITGTEMQIDHAKRLISDIIERADRNGPTPQPPYQGGNSATTIELLIPGMKAGLVIGKSGETIKSLQEEHGVKMVLVQQTNSPTPEDKPLRITGDPGRVERARQSVLNMINQRDRGGGIYGHGDQETSQYAVPAEKAGLVIGKGGESIKEICRVSGAHVEISKEPPPDQSIKIFNVRGGKQEVDQAIRMISERAGIPMTRPAAGVSGPWGQYGYAQADPWNSGATNGNSQGASGMPPPTLNPYTGQPDYSAAWAEYYRRQGMHDYADAILKQAQQTHAFAMQQPTQVQPGQMAPQQPAAPAGGPAQVPVQGQSASQGQYDYNQWQQWQQWQAWQQQQAWQGGAPGQQSAGGCAPQQMQNPGAGHPPMPQQ